MSTPKQQLLATVAEMKKLLRQLEEAGEPGVSFFRPPLRRAERPRSRRQGTAGGPAASEPLDRLAEVVAGCQKCVLFRDRRQTVFGEGDPRARLVFIGEAPGAEEDREGRPFVGAAGKLLTRIIAAIGLQREQVYICNVLKCRPPGNRNPLPEEIAACRPYLLQQLQLLKPEALCLLGTFAAQTLLESTQPIGRLRGREFVFQGIPVFPTLHPAALLYHPQNKRQVWEDMKRIALRLGLTPRPAGRDIEADSP